MKTAVFGGSFDPPHIGHSFIITLALSEGMDEVIIIPAGTHAFGKKMTDFSLRYRMCIDAFSIFGEKVIVSDVENFPEHTGKTFDTLCILQDKFPEKDFTLYIGEDNFSRWNDWYKSDEIKKRWNIKVIGRGEDSQMDFHLPDISSTKIRRMISAGFSGYLPVNKNVLSTISENHLYETISNISVVIIGMGKVGSSIYKTLKSKGINVLHTFDTQFSDTSEYCKSFSEINFSDADLVFLCTPDGTEFDFDNKVTCPVLSVSGNQFPAERFHGHDPEKALLFHPAAAITDRFSNLDDVFWALIPGSKITHDDLKLIDSLGLSFAELPEKTDLCLYHAACNISSNGVFSLRKASQDILTSFCGLSNNNSQQLINSLIKYSSTFSNINNIDRLSGPVYRKQWDLIFKHINALELKSTNLSNFYISVISGICDLFEIESPIFLKNRFEKNHEKP
ncbi:DUF2520 domain-containing protein [Myxococcota bacterium]|nr:DUF2520 domain-containing protein [Myxococcota bacterium]MBU1379380.1 DUF2520 domain-containing protein [Myxococcota bacterium]MBU1496782.1 DUF2520 domain-containing protein [Myxococcota bacterium]